MGQTTFSNELANACKLTRQLLDVITKAKRLHAGSPASSKPSPNALSHAISTKHTYDAAMRELKELTIRSESYSSAETEIISHPLRIGCRL